MGEMGSLYCCALRFDDFLSIFSLWFLSCSAGKVRSISRIGDIARPTAGWGINNRTRPRNENVGTKKKKRRLSREKRARKRICLFLCCYWCRGSSRSCFRFPFDLPAAIAWSRPAIVVRVRVCFRAGNAQRIQSCSFHCPPTLFTASRGILPSFRRQSFDAHRFKRGIYSSTKLPPFKASCHVQHNNNE